jgi:hypothetical protein
MERINFNSTYRGDAHHHEMVDEQKRHIRLWKVVISVPRFFDPDVVDSKTFYVLAEDAHGAEQQAASDLWYSCQPDNVTVDTEELPVTVRGWGSQTF